MKNETTLVFAVDDTTRITNAGKNMPFGELKKGMRLSVKYRKHAERMIAVRIRVLPFESR